MRLTIQYEGRQRIVDTQKDDVVLGRTSGDARPDVDLTPDATVSRRHARIWLREGSYWVQDLGSSYGTFVNGIALNYKRQLLAGDHIRIGESHITVAPTSDDEFPTVRELDGDMPTVREMPSRPEI